MEKESVLLRTKQRVHSRVQGQRCWNEGKQGPQKNMPQSVWPVKYLGVTTASQRDLPPATSRATAPGCELLCLVHHCPPPGPDQTQRRCAG